MHISTEMWWSQTLTPSRQSTILASFSSGSPRSRDTLEKQTHSFTADVRIGNTPWNCKTVTHTVTKNIPHKQFPKNPTDHWSMWTPSNKQNFISVTERSKSSEVWVRLYCSGEMTTENLSGVFVPAQKAEVLLMSGLRGPHHNCLECLAVQCPDVRLGHSWMRVEPLTFINRNSAWSSLWRSVKSPSK